MADIKDIEARVARLEGLIEAIAEKVGVVTSTETAPRAAEPPSPPQPVVLQPPPPEPPRPVIFIPATKEAIPEKLTMSKEDKELLIGRKVLPVVGAVAVIVGFILLAALALSNGWITPTAQFAGELLLCTAFVIIGIRKVQEQFSFGTIMVAVGFSGFYCSLAGAFFVKGLILGETMGAGFMLVSLASHAFSYVRSSKPFLFLGLLGGVSAAMMALRTDNFILNLVLHGLAMLPAWALLVRKEWADEALPLWIVTTLFTIPALLGSYYLHTTDVGATLLFWLFSFIWGHVALQADPEGRVTLRELVFIGVLATGITPFLLALSTGQVLPSVNPWLIYAATLGSAACVFLSSRIGLSEVNKPRWANSALTLSLVVPPIALHPLHATLVYVGSALALVLIAWKEQKAGAKFLANAMVGLSYGAYTIWATMPGQIPAVQQVLVIGLLIASTFAAASLQTRKEEEGVLTVWGGLFVWMLCCRASFIIMAPLTNSYVFTHVPGTFVFVAGASLVAAVLGFKRLSYLTAWVYLAGLGMCLLYTFDQAAPHFSSQVGMLLGAIASGLLVMKAFVRCFPEKEEFLLSVGSTILALPLARLLWLTFTFAGGNPVASAIYSIAITAVVIATASLYKKMFGLTVVAVGVLCLAAFPYLALLDPAFIKQYWNQSHEPGAITVLATTLTYVAYTFYLRRKEFLEKIVSVTSVPMTLLATRVAYLIFVWPPFSLQNVYVVVMATIVFGVGMSMLGAARKWKLIIFGAFTNMLVAMALYPAMKVVEFGLIIPAGREITRGQNLAVLVGLSVLSLLTARAALKSDVRRDIVLHLSCGFNWAFMAGLFIHTLDLPPFFLTFDASVSISWIFYAAVLLVLGFWRREPVYRYWALGGFGVTILKVIVYDLAFLNPIVKIFVLIVLGTVMLAGGYAYIRSQRGKDIASTDESVSVS